MTAIAISYRRSDAAPIAGRIFDRLSAHYGDHAVFMDIDKIPFGVDFRSHIREILLRSDVLIAVIGCDWLGRNAAGGIRMQEEADPVRVEIETALEKKIPIIPVLIDGAKMPESSELPATFGNFAYLNAADVSSGRDFRVHLERLIGAIDRMTTPNASPHASSVERSNPRAVRPHAAVGASDPVYADWRIDTVRYLLGPLVALLVVHYAVVNALNLNTDYLRFACVLVPLASGFALLLVGGRGAGAAIIFGVALGLVGVSGMTISESLYSGDPMLPHSRFEWIDNFQFAATITLSFIIGHLGARMLRSLMKRRLRKL
jgi:hypothetical protein